MSEATHLLFETYEVEEKCTWPGTEWDGEYLKSCGSPTIGSGLFCDPNHNDCEIHSICERYQKPLDDGWEDRAWKEAV